MNLLNEYFDKIYVINLKRRSDRLLNIVKRFHKLSIEVEIVEAYDGMDPFILNQFEEYKKRPLGTGDAHELEISYSKKMIESSGAWAYLMTYKKIIETSKHRGYNRILCFDDDVIFHKNFNELLKKSLSEIPDNWKLLYLGATQHVWKLPSAISYSDTTKKKYDPNEKYYHPLLTDGSFAVGINHSVYDLILNEIKRMNCSFDSGPMRKVMQKHQNECYVLQPNLVIADVSESDIRTSRNQNELSKKLKWDLNHYDFKLDYDLISVIMPAYNAEKTIELSIQSILKQDYPNFELIIADDGSTNNTVEIIKRIAKNDRRIKVIENKINRGCYFVRNDAIRKSKGKFIAIQDADDYSLPERLTKQVIPFYHTSCKVTIGLMLRAHVTADEVKDLSVQNFIELADKRRIHKLKDDSYKYCCSHALGFMTTMYSKDVFEELGLFWEEKHSMDMEFIERLWFHTRGRLLKDEENPHWILSNTDYIEDFYKRVDDKVIISFEMNDNNITNKFKTRKNNNLKTLWRRRLNNLESYDYPSLKRKKAVNKTISEKFFQNQQYYLSRLALRNDLNKIKESHINNPHLSLLNKKFDKIFVVNLKSSLYERYTVAKHLNENNVEFQIWDGINGYLPPYVDKFNKYIKKGTGSLEAFAEFNEMEVKRGKRFVESAGAFGYIETYISILKHAKANNLNRILILEDDIILTDDFEVKLEKFFKNIPDNWKLIQFGASQYSWDNVNIDKAIEDNYYFPSLLSTCGSFAIGINSSVYEELIQLEENFEAPFDHIPLGKIYEKYKERCFVAFPNLIIPDVSTSSIRGKRDQHSHGIRMKWNLSNYAYPLPKFKLSVIITSKENLNYIDVALNKLNHVFELKWYINTIYGIRPLHSNSLLEKLEPYLTDNTTTVNYNFKSDYVLVANSEVALTNEMILQKLNSFLQINFFSKDNPIVSIDPNPLYELKYDNSTMDYPGLVSVIIPTYKRVDNLYNAIKSVVNQTYKNIEIIIVDDNGDNSSISKEIDILVEKAKKEFKKDIKLLRHKINLNGAAARNTGIMYANGSYISFLDDDDTYLPHKIEKSIKEIDKYDPSYGGVYTGFIGWNSSKNDLDRYKEGDLSFEILTLNYQAHYLHTNTALYRKESLEKINGFDESFKRHQDLEMNLRFFDHYKIGVVKEALVYLKPEATNVNNAIFKDEMFYLKEKYLKAFQYKIDKYSKLEQELIYSRNWEEVLKSFKDHQLFINFCNNQIKRGYLKVLIDVLNNRVDKNIEKKDIHDIKLLLAENKNLFAQIGQLRNEVEMLTEELDKVYSEKEWYSRTYDHLPLPYLKLGSIFRRIKVKKGF